MVPTTDFLHSLIRLRREAKNQGNFFREPEAKVVCVVRIRGVNGVDPKTRKILQLLRLRQICNAVFVKMNAATANMLRLVSDVCVHIETQCLMRVLPAGRSIHHMGFCEREVRSRDGVQARFR